MPVTLQGMPWRRCVFRQPLVEFFNKRESKFAFCFLNNRCFDKGFENVKVVGGGTKRSDFDLGEQRALLANLRLDKTRVTSVFA